MLIALGQFNAIVSDIDYNRRRMIELIVSAQAAGAAMIVFPELSLVGYPPRDLLLKPRFIDEAQKALANVASHCDERITAMVGFPERNPDPRGRALFNSVARCHAGRVVEIYRKSLLPTYDVFDELRYFEPGDARPVAAIESGNELLRAGICICEDLWNDSEFIERPLYHSNPITVFAESRVNVVVNVSASPFTVGKQAFRERLFGGQAAKHRTPIVVVNQVGGNDELIFDGASCAFDAEGRLIARARAFEEDLLLLDLGGQDAVPNRIEPYPDEIESIHDALVLGLRDYTSKCGFRSVVLGLSGGIDSAVTAALAVRALGRDAVRGIGMPSRFSSDHSVEDARQLAANLGIQFDIVPIAALHDAGESTLEALFHGTPPGVAEENMQARARGMVLMALSNKFHSLLLTTGNKSEVAVGYCTLYGDMCGGLAVISDVPKTTVYELARWMNERSGGVCIPQNTIDKAPSAELRPNQTDQDSLPPYDLLDRVLELYVERERSMDEIVGTTGLPADVVADIVRKVDRNEYKRRQMAPGLKVTSRAFGCGRRMPIARGNG